MSMSAAAAQHATPNKRKESSSDIVDAKPSFLRFSFSAPLATFKQSCRCKGCHEDIEIGEHHLSLFKKKTDTTGAAHFHCQADCFIREVIKSDSSIGVDDAEECCCCNDSTGRECDKLFFAIGGTQDPNAASQAKPTRKVFCSDCFKSLRLHAEGLGIPKALDLDSDSPIKKKKLTKKQKETTHGLSDELIEKIIENYKGATEIYAIKDDELTAVEGFISLSKEEKTEVGNACVSMDDGEYLVFVVKLDFRIVIYLLLFDYLFLLNIY